MGDLNKTTAILCIVKRQLRMLVEAVMVKEKVEGQQFTKGVVNTNMTEYTSSILTIINTKKYDI